MTKTGQKTHATIRRILIPRLNALQLSYLSKQRGVVLRLQHQVDKLNFETSGSLYSSSKVIKLIVVIYRDSISKHILELPGQSWSGYVNPCGGVLSPSLACQNIARPSSFQPSWHCGLFKKHNVGLKRS